MYSTGRTVDGFLAAESHQRFAEACAQPYNPDPTRRVLDFSSGVIDMSNKLTDVYKKVYVRRCYSPMFDESILVSQPFGVSPGTRRESPVIVGTPGTGKTFKRMYDCHRFLNMAASRGLSVHILFQKADGMGNKAVHVVQQDLGQAPEALRFEADQMDALTSLCRCWESQEHLVVSLVDVSQGKYLCHPVETSTTWFYTSPNSEFMRDRERKKPAEGCHVDIIMPIWCKAELSHANGILGLMLTDQTIDHRFSRHGGSARAVLDEKGFAEAEVAFESRLQTLDSDWVRAVTGASLTAMDVTSLSHCFFHITCKVVAPTELSSMFERLSVSHENPNEGASPGEDPLGQETADWNLKEIKVLWASPYAKHSLAEAAMTTLTREMKALLSSNDTAPGAKGELIEALWFEWFIMGACPGCAESRFELRELGDTQADRLPTPGVACLTSLLKAIPPITRKWFSKHKMAATLREQIQGLGTNSALLLQALEFQMQAIDGILLWKTSEHVYIFFLQSTIQRSHDASQAPSEYLDSLVEACLAALDPNVKAWVTPLVANVD
jgi:hypothetical protein